MLDPTRRRALLTLTTLPLLALPLAACSSSSSEDSTKPSPSGPALTVTGPWAKAADSGMTAVFATLANSTSRDVTVTGARCDAAKSVELHDTIDGTMTPVDGGFTIKAGKDLELAPGGKHIMLMGLTDALEPGADLDLVLELQGGSTVPFTAVVKDFAGAQENYGDTSDGGGDSMGDMDGMGHDHASDGGH